MRALRRAFLVGGSVAVAGIALGACGSTAPTAAQRASVAAFTPYLVRSGEEPGYSLEGEPILSSTPMEWAKGEKDPTPEVARLTSEGFRDAVIQHTAANEGAGVSWVIQLATPSAARHELKASYGRAAAEQNPVSPFAISELPGSQGFVSHGTGGSAANVWFREGSCVLLIGDLASSRTDPMPAVTAAALSIYHATEHAVGPCR
jgi:hypothetical protein